MGGFHLVDDSRNPCHPIRREDVIKLIRNRKLELPTEDEIKDNSKNDRVATCIVLLQTSWLVIQFLTRAANSLTLTKLEVVAIAYISILFSIYITWWGKPRNVTRPIRVPRSLLGHPTKITPADVNKAEKLCDTFYGFQDEYVDLSKLKRVPIFYSGFPTDNQVFLACLIALIFGGIFGAINCIAWSFPSPTFVELVLWRLSSLSIFIIYLIILAAAVFVFIVDEMDSTAGPLIVRWLPPLWGVFYVITRVVSLVLACMELRALPPGAYEVVYWTNLIPHI